MQILFRLQKGFVHIVSSKALLRANTFGQMGSPRRLFSRLFLPFGKKRYTIKGQLISKGLFGVFNCSKNEQKNEKIRPNVSQVAFFLFVFGGNEDTIICFQNWLTLLLVLRKNCVNQISC